MRKMKVEWTEKILHYYIAVKINREEIVLTGFMVSRNYKKV